MKRQIRVEGNVAYVPLTKGHEAVISSSDVHLIDMGNWFACQKPRLNGEIRTVYACRNVNIDGVKRIIKMHRVIAETPDGMETDHIDGNGLNNCRDNLRIATKSQNSCNRAHLSRSKSGIKGVYWIEKEKKWRAEIKIDRKSITLGRFQRIEDAAKAYAEASKKWHGEFGRTS